MSRAGVAFFLPMEEREDDLGVGFHLVGGADVILTENRNVGVEFRKHLVPGRHGCFKKERLLPVWRSIGGVARKRGEPCEP